jgi:hypothetical protein
MTNDRCSAGKHHNPSPSHGIGVWCNDCGQFVHISHFDPIPETYLGDLRDHVRIRWDTETRTWRRVPVDDR